MRFIHVRSWERYNQARAKSPSCLTEEEEHLLHCSVAAFSSMVRVVSYELWGSLAMKPNCADARSVRVRGRHIDAAAEVQRCKG